MYQQTFEQQDQGNANVATIEPYAVEQQVYSENNEYIILQDEGQTNDEDQEAEEPEEILIEVYMDYDPAVHCSTYRLCGRF